MKKNSKKNKITFLILIIVTIIVLYFSLKDDYKTIINQILSINIFWLFIGIFLVFSYWYLKSMIIYKFAKKFNKNYTFKNSLKMIVITQFFNAVTPFASGGQPYEIYSLKKDGLRLTDATNIAVQEFVTYQIALLLLGIFAIIYNNIFNIFPENLFLKNLVFIGFLVNFLVIVGLFIISFGGKLKNIIINFIINLLFKLKIIKNKKDKIKYWDEVINNFNRGTKLLFEHKRNFISAIVFNLLSLLAIYLIPMVILYGMGDYNSLSSINGITCTAYVMLIGSFVPTPGGTGGLEYGFIQFFSNFITGSKLSAIMLLWRFLTYYLGMIIGAIVLNIRSRGE